MVKLGWFFSARLSKTTEEFKVLNYGGSNSQTANPYWMANHEEYNERRNRFFGFAKIYYEFTDWLSAFVRVGADVTDTKTKRITKPGHHFYRGGRIRIFPRRKCSRTN